MAPKDLALRRSDKRLALILIGGHSPNFKSSVPFNRWSSKLVGTLPEMVQTIVPKDFTQYCSSPPLYTMISYGYTLSLDQTRAARARSAPPRSSTTDLVIRAISTKFELWRAREILSDVGVQLFTLKITQHEFAL